MVDIVYDRDELKLTVKGHANGGAFGKDIVCSAVSILVYTLSSNVVQMSSDKKHIRRPVIKLDEGDAIISCSPVHGMRAIATMIFDSICSGFDILAQNFPDNVSYTVKG